MYRVRVIYIKDMIQEKKKLLKQRLIIVSSPLVRGWYRECYFKGWGGGISGMFLFFFDFGGFREDLIGWTTWHRWPMTLMCMCAPSFLFFSFRSKKERTKEQKKCRNWGAAVGFSHFTLQTSVDFSIPTPWSTGLSQWQKTHRIVAREENSKNKKFKQRFNWFVKFVEPKGPGLKAL